MFDPRQCSGKRRVAIGVQPFPQNEESRYDLRFDPFRSLSEFDQDLTPAVIAAMRESCRIQDPVLRNAVLLAGGELGAGVTPGGARAQHLDNQIRRTRDTVVRRRLGGYTPPPWVN